MAERKGTAEQVARTLAEASAWLANHPDDHYVRTAYLGLAERKGTAEQVARTLAEASAWLANHPDDKEVRRAYLGLAERKGTAEQVARTLAEASAWLANNPEDHNVRAASLGLAERKGTAEQVARTLAETSAWLANHPDDSEVRKASLGLAERKGTAEQVARTLAETSAWLSSHTEDAEVQRAYMGLVERQGTPEQVLLAIAAARSWIIKNSLNENVLVPLLGLVARRSTAEEKRAVAQQTQKWLKEKPALEARFTVRNSLAQLFLSLGLFSEAEDLFRAALKLPAGSNAGAHRGLAMALMGMKRFHEARKILEWLLSRAMKSGDSLGRYYQDLGLFHLEREDCGVARRYLEQAIEDSPDNFANYWHLGRVLMKQECFDEAVEALQKAIELAPPYLMPPARDEIPALIAECHERLNM